MRWRSGAHGLTALLLFAAVVACHRAPPTTRDAPIPVAADSIEGVVRVVGVDALPRTVLAIDDGQPTIDLLGSKLLPRVAGLRVAVIGTRNGRTFTVSRFAVIAANGVRAVDGMLTAQGDALWLVTPSGARYAVNGLSAALREDVGHRVWISGLQDGAAVAYGVIE